MDHRHLDEGFTGFRQLFVIFTEASIAIEPPEGAFHNPALGDDHKSLDGVRALRHLQAVRPLGPQRPHPVHQRSGIGPRSAQMCLLEKTDRLYRNLKDWVTLDDLDLRSIGRHALRKAGHAGKAQVARFRVFELDVEGWNADSAVPKTF